MAVRLMSVQFPTKLLDEGTTQAAGHRQILPFPKAVGTAAL